jgi:hypothetical protein
VCVKEKEKVCVCVYDENDTHHIPLPTSHPAEQTLSHEVIRHDQSCNV